MDHFIGAIEDLFVIGIPADAVDGGFHLHEAGPEVAAFGPYLDLAVLAGGDQGVAVARPFQRDQRALVRVRNDLFGLASLGNQSEGAVHEPHREAVVQRLRNRVVDVSRVLVQLQKLLRHRRRKVPFVNHLVVRDADR